MHACIKQGTSFMRGHVVAACATACFIALAALSLQLTERPDGAHITASTQFMRLISRQPSLLSFEQACGKLQGSSRLLCEGFITAQREDRWTAAAAWRQACSTSCEYSPADHTPTVSSVVLLDDLRGKQLVSAHSHVMKARCYHERYGSPCSVHSWVLLDSADTVWTARICGTHRRYAPRNCYTASISANPHRTYIHHSKSMQNRLWSCLLQCCCVNCRCMLGHRATLPAARHAIF